MGRLETLVTEVQATRVAINVFWFGRTSQQANLVARGLWTPHSFFS